MWGVIGLIAVIAVRVPAAAAAGRPAEAATGWEELTGCRLAPDPYADGDSFLVRHGTSTNRFRLLFVDAPETDAGTNDQVEEQARHFGIAPDRIRDLGLEARDFTAKRLADGFRVVTRWTQAPSRGRLPRFHAIVLVGRTNLGAELVRHGLARIHDTNPVPAGDPHKRAWLAELEAADREARRAGRGGWDRQRFPAVAGSASRPTPAIPAPVNLNIASTAELEALPGIGPALARRIRDARPFGHIEDLRRIPGIGPKTYSALTNRVTVGRSGKH